MFSSQKIICGNGSNGNAGDFHRAVAVASELYAAGRWNGGGRLVIHRPHDLHRELSLTAVLTEALGKPDARHVKIHQGVYALVAGKDFEVLPDL